LGATAQEDSFIASKERASQLFLSGDYSGALNHYNSLSDKFPADPIYKYHSGVCLVLMSKDPLKSIGLLKEASDKSSSLRPVPVDNYFYLGRAYQQAGLFSEAIKSYNRFIENSKRKEVKEYGVENLIEQCSLSRGAVEEIKPVKPEQQEIAKENPVVSLPDEIVSANVIEIEETNTDATKDTQIDSSYDELAKQAMVLQFRADSVNRLADRYRVRLKDLSGNERESISQKILSLEQLGFDFQTEADKKFNLASGVLSLDIPTKEVSGAVTELSKKIPEISLKVDTVEVLKNEKTVLADTLSQSIPEVKKITPPVLTLFNENYASAQEIPVNSQMPEGLYYRIQTAAFRNPVKPDYFKSLGPVYGFKASDSDITFFHIGLFRAKADADRALVKVRNQGFKDAFVVAVLDNNRVSMERAAALESEWRDKTLAGNSFISPTHQAVNAEPLEPPTLVYRVELKRVLKALKPEEVDSYRKMAGSREFDILTSVNKEFVYLIGKFITFESALSYSDLIYRNGVKEAKVVAYLGNREIPLEKAKELFELYFKQ
jgi:tetratricopeptide (TPR) repeat protein